MKPIIAAVLAALLCTAIPAPASAQTLDAARELFYAQRYDESLAILQSLDQDSPRDARVLGWIAENLYRLNDLDSALGAAREALNVDACHAQAHALIANVHVVEWHREGAADSSRVHARRAAECDPADGNAWLASWSSAMVRRDTADAAEAQRRLTELRFVPGPVMERGRWMLRSAPANAVIVTGGDWDYFPMSIAQTVEGLRPDVYLVQRTYLEFPWYVRQVARETGLPVPPQVAELADDEWMPLATDSAGALPFQAGAHWARAALDGSARPLVIAGTALPDLVEEAAWPRWEGVLYTLRPRDEAPADGELRIHEPAFAASMANLRIEALAGPPVHPDDRSPVRRSDSHPAEFVALPVAYYGIQRFYAGDLEGARQALAWADALIATGHISEERAANIADLRAAVESDGEP